MTVDLLWTQQIAAALTEYAYRHKHAASLQPASSVLSYSSEFVLPNGQRRHVGGYADRLKGLLSTALLAMLSERRFVVEWLTPHAIRDILTPHTLAWDVASDTRATASAHSSIIDGIDDAAHARLRAGLLDRPDAFERLHGHEHPIKIHTNIDYLRDLLANPALLTRTRLGRLLAFAVASSGADAVAAWLFGALFRFLFRYTPHGVFLDTWLRFLDVRQARAIVGVQFRTGGAGHWNDPAVDTLASVGRMAAAAVTAARNAEFENPLFFVSTDHEGASAALHDALHPEFEVLRFGFQPTHFERSAGSDVESQAASPILEHMCLSHCDIVVHGWGGFGRTAALLGGAPAFLYGDF